MIPFVTPLIKKYQLKRNLLGLIDEMEKNLEAFYVMEQRQFVTEGFLLKAWTAIKDEEIVKKHSCILAYAQALDKFNTLLKEHKAYEQWYASSLENKSQENARKLHGMKNELDANLKGMDALIIPAGQALEREMIQLGFISYE